MTFKTIDRIKMDKQATGRRKVAELDALISTHEQLIEKLNEMRRECINVYDLNKGDQNA